MDCAEAKLQIESYVAGEIDPAQKESLESHLAECAECRLDSELTRASRNTPAIAEERTGDPDPNAPNDPDAPSAPFIESIRPGSDPADSPPSSSGVAALADSRSTDAPPSPSGAGSGGNGSWTLESIFGNSGPASASESAIPLAQRAAAAAEPLPESPLMDALSGPEPRDPADEPPPSDAPTWDFEPADVKGSTKPPEGSLFFAEEALSRGTGKKKKKSGIPRVVVWSAGGLLGLGLLALSIWIALTVRQPLPSPIVNRRPIRAGAGPVTPVPVPTDATVASGSETTSSESGATDAGAGAGTPNGGTSGTEGETPVMAPSTGVTAPGTPVPSAGTPSSMGVAPGTTASPPVTTLSPPVPTGRTPSPKTAPARPRGTSSPASTASRAPAPSKTTKSAPASTTAPVNSQGPAAGPSSGTAAGPASGTPPSNTSPSPNTTGSATAPAGTTAPPGTSTAGGTSTPPASSSTSPTTAPETAPSPTTASPPTEASDKPIDRLHVATLNAEQNADLIALRKLREAWRGYLKTSVGPDRARAKRELADCLWAIQTLTSKTSDQKEALAAYRDYVLNAPAGGADARTVARMRQLEDAVTEAR